LSNAKEKDRAKKQVRIYRGITLLTENIELKERGSQLDKQLAVFGTDLQEKGTKRS